MSPKKILFITWDGPNQNYVDGLFLPIFAYAQSISDFRFEVMQFGWQSAQQVELTRQLCIQASVSYEHVRVSEGRYAKSLISSYAIMKGARNIAKRVKRGDIAAIMPRSLIPAAMVLLMHRWFKQVPILFDADGLMADERVEFEGWSSTGVHYRVLRDIEAQMVRIATAVWVRGDEAARIMIERSGPNVDISKFHAIPNARNEQLFCPVSESMRIAVRSREQIEPDMVWVLYVGSLGAKYNTNALFEIFDRLQQRNIRARFYVLTSQAELAYKELRKFNINRDSIRIIHRPNHEIPLLMASADVGLYFGQPYSYSLRGASPIKVSEYLLCGLPTIASSGTNWLDSSVSGCEDVVHLVHNLDGNTLESAIDWVLNSVLPKRDTVRQRSRELGLKHFSLQAHMPSYLKLFECALV